MGTLIWAQHKAKKEGVVQDTKPFTLSGAWGTVINFADALDVPGLVLLTAGFALLLVPLTLAESYVLVLEG